ncbi:3-hydroxyacyl-ACP dehydratase FabZ family protein [Salaquimonas pukyongi]|uniref:3-hydroxyacyl-ACP dehydratase FabZ family protein n=1 Tax=Salaquimonas pukyongi TaxID=2712698 RepID=UPI00096BC734|nr:3-hydroxyacyl-ACP dehydratase FabZ family protein [Salaquimonas pukyongi]
MQLEYFQMIDRITEVDLEAKVMHARSTVPDESTVFEGHFPGHPLVPGVLMIETMAQCSGILIMHTIDFAKIPLLAGVKEGKLRDFVGPRTALEIKAEIEHEGSGFAVTRAEIRSQGKRVANAQLTFTIMPFPSDELQGMIRQQVAGMKQEPA